LFGSDDEFDCVEQVEKKSMVWGGLGRNDWDVDSDTDEDDDVDDEELDVDEDDVVRFFLPLNVFEESFSIDW